MEITNSKPLFGYGHPNRKTPKTDPPWIGTRSFDGRKYTIWDEFFRDGEANRMLKQVRQLIRKKAESQTPEP